MDITEITGAWDPATLPRNIRVGRNCYLENKGGFGRFFSERDPGLVLGDGVAVYTWTSFSIEREGFMEVGDETVLVGAQFMCAEHIRIGSRVVISYNVTIADSDFHPRDPDVRREDVRALAPGSTRPRPPLDSSPVSVDDGAWIGIGALILKGVHIGAGAHVGAGSVVTRDVPANARVSGNPARPVDEAPTA